MTSTDENLPRIGPAVPDEAGQALRLVFSRLAPEDRADREKVALADARSGKTSLAGLLVARRQGRLVGAIYAQVQPGRTALVWPPRLAAEEPHATAQQLVEATTRWLAGQQVCVAHTLMEVVTDQDDAVLRDGGYRPLAKLLYLVSGEEEFPGSPPASPLRFEPYSPANHKRLTQVTLDTYERTLDCPALNGVREIEDVLAGYRATGQFAAQRWLIVRHQGRDIGCLLLTDHPEQQSCELMYMGLVVSARGHGWGTDLARHAQWLTRQAGRRRLVLAVDEANLPALQVYHTAGFQTWERRWVYGKTFSARR